eukprot:scaffold1561_cov404-Prasinococcus_capsulatus_cf.AAC.3
MGVDEVGTTTPQAGGSVACTRARLSRRSKGAGCRHCCWANAQPIASSPLRQRRHCGCADGRRPDCEHVAAIRSHVGLPPLTREGTFRSSHPEKAESTCLADLNYSCAVPCSLSGLCRQQHQAQIPRRVCEGTQSAALPYVGEEVPAASSLDVGLASTIAYPGRVVRPGAAHQHPSPCRADRRWAMVYLHSNASEGVRSRVAGTLQRRRPA